MREGAAQIAHESLSQRQHVRVEIPATAEIDGHRYKVGNLSAGGMRVEGLNKSFRAAQVVNLCLDLPFEAFSLSVDLRARVEYCDDFNKVMGCRFIDLQARQVSILSFILNSFLSGTVVTEGDMLNVVSRDNFTVLRNTDRPVYKTGMVAALRRVLPTIAATVIGLAALAFAASNIYEKMFIVRSNEAVVATEIITARAVAAGVFTSKLAAGATQVTTGQELGVIEGSGATSPGAGGKNVTALKSPCDCLVTRQLIRDGEFRDIGEPVFTLIPIEVRPWVEAKLPLADAARVHAGDDARIRMAGTGQAIPGRVEGVDAPDDANNEITVRVRPDEVFTPDQIGNPAFVKFFVE